MSKVVDHLAELTGFRDRDLQDTMLATVLRDLLQPLCVSIHRCVGDEKRRRWLMRARVRPGDLAAASDPIWQPFESLPRLDDHPERVQALAQAEPVSLAGPPLRTLYALSQDPDSQSVLEIESTAPLTAEAQTLLYGVLRVYRNFQALLDYSERDTLTGLLNRKTFDDAFYKLQSAPQALPPPGADRRQQPAAPRQHYIGVIDIDHFKQVNDRFGHLIGDEVLLLVSRLMRASFRFSDRLFRFGGEEFVVLLACEGEANAHKAMERFRTAVQATDFPQVGRITISLGFTEVRPTDTASTAFERADQAVYWVKHNGRNQVAGHEAMVRSGELNDESRAGDVELF